MSTFPQVLADMRRIIEATSAAPAYRHLVRAEPGQGHPKHTGRLREYTLLDGALIESIPGYGIPTTLEEVREVVMTIKYPNDADIIGTDDLHLADEKTLASRLIDRANWLTSILYVIKSGAKVNRKAPLCWEKIITWRVRYRDG